MHDGAKPGKLVSESVDVVTASQAYAYEVAVLDLGNGEVRRRGHADADGCQFRH
jgi:hypothetical protein